MGKNEYCLECGWHKENKESSFCSRRCCMIYWGKENKKKELEKLTQKEGGK